MCPEPKHLKHLMQDVQDMGAGYYCAYDPKLWDMIDPKQCETCKHAECIKALTTEEIDKMAQELCFYFDKGPKCHGNCKECDFPQFWHSFRLPVKKVIKFYENMRGK